MLHLFSTLLPREMFIQFDFRKFFRWVETTNHQLADSATSHTQPGCLCSNLLGSIESQVAHPSLPREVGNATGAVSWLLKAEEVRVKNGERKMPSPKDP